MYADFLDPGTCLHRLVVSFWAPACPKHRKYSGCNRRTRIWLTPGPAYRGGLDPGTCFAMFGFIMCLLFALWGAISSVGLHL